MLTVPIQDTPAQILRVTLGGQACQIVLRQRSTGLYCDLSINDLPIITGVVCVNLGRIVRSAYLGFLGDLLFIDTQGTSDPSSPGLGARYLLQYIQQSELA
jgi:hypothetical protein